MSSVSFDTLPGELIEQALLYLPAADLVTALCLNKKLNTFISGSDALQYVLALRMNGMVGGLSSLSRDAKRKELSGRNKAWRTLATLDLPQRRTTVSVPFPASLGTVRVLSSGAYLMGERGIFDEEASDETVALRMVEVIGAGTNDGGSREAELGEKREGEGLWRRMTIPGRILGSGSCLQEYDLIAIVGLRESETDQESYDIVLHLKQYSTGLPHPLANEPEIIVGHCPRTLRDTTIKLEIVGPSLVLLFRELPSDVLLLLNWWTGAIITRELLSKYTYSSFAFLSHDAIILPNAEERTLEILQLPDPPNPIIKYGPSDGDKYVYRVRERDVEFDRIKRLRLPRLWYDIDRIICRSYPNPFSVHHHPEYADGELVNGYKCDQPFSMDPIKALVLVQIFYDESKYLNLVFQRDKILATARNDDYVDRRRPWVVIRGNLYIPNIDFPYGEDDEDGETIPWWKWSPGSVRFCAGEETGAPWCTAIIGERYVGLCPSSRELVVRDFNPYRVKQLRKTWATAVLAESRGREDVDRERRRRRVNIRLMESFDKPDKTKLTLRKIIKGVLLWKELPFIETTMKLGSDCDWSGLLVDEERIIGLKRDPQTKDIVELDIFSL